MTRPCLIMAYLDFTALDGMTGELTRNDIAEGQQGLCELCPISRAVERMFEGFQVSTEFDHVTVQKNGETCVVLRVSTALAEWMTEFDDEQDVEPIGLQIYTWNVKDYKYMIDVL